MEGFVGLLALITIGAFIWWMPNAFWKVANQKVLDRKGHANGQSAIESKRIFVVPGTLASEVVRSVVSALGYPTTKSTFAHEVILVGATDTQAVFALANKMGQAWESRLLVADESDGAHGKYEVVRWTMADGVAAGWKEMEIVDRRIGEIVTAIGGGVQVTVPE